VTPIGEPFEPGETGGRRADAHRADGDAPGGVPPAPPRRDDEPTTPVRSPIHATAQVADPRDD
jgi:hypothetical protein